MSSNYKEEIKRWRYQIDKLDRDLVRLLNERTECAIQIGRIKAESGIAVYDPEREEEVAQNVRTSTHGPMSRVAVQRIFERIIDETRRTEREDRKRIASKNAVDLKSESTLKDVKP